MLLIASFGLTFWFGAESPLRRLAAAAVILVLVVGGFSVLGTHTHWPYEAWLAIGCAVGLLALAVASNRERPLAALGRADAVALTGATVLLASLFFNWQGSCAAGPNRTCYVSNGWGGGLTGGLVGILVVLLLGFRYLSPELAVDRCDLRARGRARRTQPTDPSAMARLSASPARRFSWSRWACSPGSAFVQAFGSIPVAASLAFLAIPVAALSGRLSTDIEINGAWRLVLLEAAAIVVGLRLIGRWLTGPAADIELLFLPVALLALTSLDLGERQHVYIIGWEGWLALASPCSSSCSDGSGSEGGLDNFRIPDEIWRVDRISAGEN